MQRIASAIAALLIGVRGELPITNVRLIAISVSPFLPKQPMTQTNDQIRRTEYSRCEHRPTFDQPHIGNEKEPNAL